MLKKLIQAVAPTLGSFIGGSFGEKALTIVSNILTGTSDASQEQIEKIIKDGDPELLAKLRQADLDYKQKLAQLGIDSDKISSLDRKNARSRELELTKLLKKRDWVPSILAIIFLLGFFIFVGVLLFHTIPTGVKELAANALGVLEGMIMSIAGYYFGSSEGSKTKTLLTKIGTER